MPTSASGDPADVTLSVGQMRINQRIAQAAVLRANALAGGLPGAAASGDGPGITLSAGQLAINQRISVAAVRRADALLRTEGASSAPA